MTTLMDLAACLNPHQSFYRFDNAKIFLLAQVYAGDFIQDDRLDLEVKLPIFESTVTRHPDFAVGLNSIRDLLSRMFLSGLEESFPIYSRFIRLVPTLPVSTATTERSFSALKIVKTRLRMVGPVLNHTLFGEVQIF